MIKANLPWVESPFFNEIIKTKELSPAQLQMAKDYHNNGYLSFSGIIPEDLINRVKDESEKKAFNKEFPIQTFRDEQRVQDFWQVSDATRELASFEPIIAILEMLYGREAIPFQTLNFSVGTQQKAHSDTIHFSSLPAKFMCGVWIALEDVTEENGPLFYYPGSQTLPEYNFSLIKESAASSSYDDYHDYEDFIEEIVRVNDFKQEVFKAKKGDVLIWSSNIIHGGMPVLKEGSSRWSQVTHYFFKDCYYYTPMLSNMVTDELYLRTHLVNIKTGEKVTPSYNGEVIGYLKTNKTQYIFNHGIKISRILQLLTNKILGK